MTDQFDQDWQRIRISEEEAVSPQLRAVVEPVYRLLVMKSQDLAGIRAALIGLLEFLAGAEGRTHANCVKTDYFFSLNDNLQWEYLPREFEYLIDDVAGALHDTATAPLIADRLSSMPEQLLARALELDVEPREWKQEDMPRNEEIPDDQT